MKMSKANITPSDNIRGQKNLFIFHGTLKLQPRNEDTKHWSVKIVCESKNILRPLIIVREASMEDAFPYLIFSRVKEMLSMI